MNDKQIHHILNVSQATIIRVRKKFATSGLEGALEELSRCGRPMKFDGYQRAQITALACSAPPAGHSHWSLRLLADQLVELDVVEGISHETVGAILKKPIEASPEKAVVYWGNNSPILVADGNYLASVPTPS